jgi:hypothetical protein
MSQTLIAQTEIEGYEVIIEEGYEGENDRTHCYVSRGRFSASLQCLEDTGVLSDGDREKQVPAWIIGDISNWAYNNGHM